MRKYLLIAATLAFASSLAGVGAMASAQATQTSVETKVQTVESEIPAVTKYVFDRTVGAGRLVKRGTGEPGLQATTTTFTYFKGKLVKEKKEVKVVRPASDIVFAMGPAGYPKASRSGSFSARKVLTMNSSAYIANEGAMNPTDNTATGRKCEYGIVAVDPRVIPLHTLLYIEGYGYGIAADTGGMIKGKKIDLCMSTRSQMNAWGRRNVQVHVLQKLTDKQLEQMGVVEEGATEKVHDTELLALATAASPLVAAAPAPVVPPRPQPAGDDPASTPGRDPSEPAPTSITPSRPVSGGTTSTSPDPGPAAKTVTLTKDINVRERASGASTTVALALRGDVLKLGAETDGWYEVTTASGTKGFARADQLGLAKEPTPTPTDPPVVKAKVARDDVIVREGPTTSSDKLTNVSQGTEVSVLEVKGGWHKVRLKDGQTGYIRSDMFEARDDDGEPSAPVRPKKKKSSDDDPPKKKATSSKKKKSGDDDPPKKKATSSKKKKSSDDDPPKKKSSSTKKKKSSDDDKPKKKATSSKKSGESSSKKKSSTKKKG